MHHPHFEGGEQFNNINLLQSLLRSNLSPSFALPDRLITTFMPGMATRRTRRWNNIKGIPDEIGADL